MASGNFERCLKEVLNHEGGWVHDDQDPGGETNYGVTKRTARAHGYRGSMKAIPMSVVERIYRSGYWDAVKADELPSGLDLAVFDFAVNSGPSRALAFLKTVDRKDPSTAIRLLCMKRLAWLRDLRTFKRFGKGWTRRVNSVEVEALRMAGIAEPIETTKLIPQLKSQVEPKEVPATPMDGFLADFLSRGGK